jgi:hypothetical protein
MRFLAAVLVVQVLLAIVLIVLVATHNVHFVEGVVARTHGIAVPTL